jgi:hypothetical protein
LKINEQQVIDWTENPVTLALRELCERELEAIMSVPPSEYLIRDEPQRTQENVIENTTKQQEWETFIELLSGDWTEIDDEDRDIPLGE